MKHVIFNTVILPVTKVSRSLNLPPLSSRSFNNPRVLCNRIVCWLNTIDKSIYFFLTLFFGLYFMVWAWPRSRWRWLKESKTTRHIASVYSIRWKKKKKKRNNFSIFFRCLILVICFNVILRWRKNLFFKIESHVEMKKRRKKNTFVTYFSRSNQCNNRYRLKSLDHYFYWFAWHLR